MIILKKTYESYIKIYQKNIEQIIKKKKIFKSGKKPNKKTTIVCINKKTIPEKKMVAYW